MSSEETRGIVDIPEDIQKMGFEEAMTELESIVERLETGDVVLEESIAIYQRGHKLRLHCDGKLKSAQLKVEQITEAGCEPLDID